MTSPRPAHPDMSIINETLHALYYHYPDWVKRNHYVLLDGCPTDEQYWEHKWCTQYEGFVANLRAELHSRPYFERVEVVDPPSWTDRMGLSRLLQHGFQKTGVQPNDVVFIQQDDMRLISSSIDVTKVVRRTRSLTPPYVRLRLRNEDQVKTPFTTDACGFRTILISSWPVCITTKSFQN